MAPASSPISNYDPVNVPVSAWNGKFEHAQCLGMTITKNLPFKLADMTEKDIKRTSQSQHVDFLPSLAHAMRNHASDVYLNLDFSPAFPEKLYKIFANLLSPI